MAKSRSTLHPALLFVLAIGLLPSGAAAQRAQVDPDLLSLLLAGRSLAGIQTMGTGEIDVLIGGAPTDAAEPEPAVTDVPGGIEEVLMGPDPPRWVPDPDPFDEDEETLGAALEEVGRAVRERWEDGADDGGLLLRGIERDEVERGVVVEPPTGAAREAPPAAEDAPPERDAPAAEDAPGAEADSAPVGGDAGPSDATETGSAPGYIVWSAVGEPLEGVVLGQPFWLELRLSPDDAGLPGRAGGLREFRWLDVTLRSEDGAEREVRLERQDEPSEDGLVRFLAGGPISLSGTWRKPDGAVLKSGSVEGLDLDIAGWEAVRLVVPGVTGGTSAVRVYGDEIELGAVETERRLRQVTEILTNERDVARAILADPAVADHPETAAEVQAWLDRTQKLLELVEAGLERMEAAEDPRDRLRVGKARLSVLLKTSPDGYPIVLDVPTARRVGDAENREMRLQEEELREGILDALAGYAVLSYSLLARASLGAAIHQLAYGRDEFDQDASKVLALVEIAGALVSVWLPGAIARQVTEWKAGGFGVDIRLPGSGGGPPGGGIVPRRPGRLAAMTDRGRNDRAPYAGAPRAKPRPPRPKNLGPLGRETAGGALAYPGTGARRGLDPDDVRHWQNQIDGSGLGRDRANEIIVHMDEVVADARRSGLPDEVIGATMREARRYPLGDAREFVIGRLELEIAHHTDQRIFLYNWADVAVLRAGRIDFDGAGRPFVPEAGAFPAATPEHMRGMSVFRRGVGPAADEVGQKAIRHVAGDPQQWSPEEIAVAVAVRRRLERGATGREDPRNWHTVEVDDWSSIGFDGREQLDRLEYTGIRRMFRDDELEAIRTVFDPSRNAPGGVTTPPAPLRTTPTPRRPSPAVLDPARVPVAIGGPSGRGGPSSPVEVVIQSIGGSTGPVLTAHIVNFGEEPIRIVTDALVLEPVDEEELDPAERARLDEILEAVSGGKPVPPPGSDPSPGSRGGENGARGSGGPFAAALGGPFAAASGPNPGADSWRDGVPASRPDPRRANVVTVVLDGYCLELAKAVPEEGVLFRIADAEAQAAAARYREIIRASRRLQERDALDPDGDPESYFHSIRQWAAWTDENGFDREEFEEAFVVHARKNFDAAGRPWTDEVEEVVRSLAPNRWKDVTAILEEAGGAGRDSGSVGGETVEVSR